MFKFIRKNYWLTREFLKRHYRTVFTATLIGILVVGGLALFSRYLPTPKKTIRIARVGKYTPATIPEDIKEQVSLGLIRVDDEGTIGSAIAEGWEITDNGTTYTFAINKKLKWHNGASVKPEDLRFAFKEVEQEFESDRVILHLKEPFAPLLSILAKPILKNDRLGVSEYRITDIKSPGGVLQSITIASTDTKKIYKFYPTEASAITALQLGEVDRIEDISYVPEELVTSGRLLVKASERKDKIAALFFNNNDTVLSGKSARQALAYAIQDKGDGFERAISPISNSSWAFNPNVKEYSYDTDRARELFATDVENPSDTVIEIKTVLQHLDTAEKIAQDWKEVLGIQTEVKVTTSLTDDYQAILLDYAPPVDPDQYTIWHSTQTTNFTHYQNLKVDKLLEDGRRVLNQKERTSIYHDFQRFLLEDSPAVFLFYTQSFTVERKPLF